MLFGRVILDINLEVLGDGGEILYGDNAVLVEVAEHPLGEVKLHRCGLDPASCDHDDVIRIRAEDPPHVDAP